MSMYLNVVQIELYMNIYVFGCKCQDKLLDEYKCCKKNTLIVHTYVHSCVCTYTNYFCQYTHVSIDVCMYFMPF